MAAIVFKFPTKHVPIIIKRTCRVCLGTGEVRIKDCRGVERVLIVCPLCDGSKKEPDEVKEGK